jgi:quercetin dioxygenase-like cupin family protein
MSSPRLLVNPATGEEVTILSEGPEVLVLETRWPRPGHRASTHVHPKLEERFEILEGRAGFRIAGVAHEAGPGDVVVVPSGAAHLAWNASDGPTRVRLEFRPPGRWLEVMEQLFANPDRAATIALLRDYPDELALP